MKSQNTSRPFGDAATKLTSLTSVFAPVADAQQAASARHRTKNAVMAATIALLVCVLASVTAYAAVDLGLNDSFVAWFNRVCMDQELVNVNGAGLMYSHRVVDWEAVRSSAAATVCALTAAGAVFTALACFAAYQIGARRTLVKTEEVIDDLLGRHDVRVERYPRSFAAIVARIGELKSAARNREHTIQDETGRKNDLITYLAHDLKTPLASVVGYLNLLCETPDMPCEQRSKCLLITLAKANQLENLIEEFFDIARYSLQRIELDRTEVCLELMLVQLADEFQPLFAQHGNTVEVSCDEDLMVYADAERLARVFNNILKNAVAYSHRDTPIAIRVLRNPRTVCIQFQSTGDTISRQKLDLVFEKFYRLDEARNGSTGGAGLGLAIAKEIVSLHGGTIAAKSEEGVTTFTVVLPT